MRRWRRPRRGSPGVHAALYRGRGAGERDLLEGHAYLALVHHLVRAGMLLDPGRLGQDPCAQGESGVLMCGLGLVRGLEHLRVAALHGRRDERVAIWEVQVDRGGGYRHRAGDGAQRHRPRCAGGKRRHAVRARRRMRSSRACRSRSLVPPSWWLWLNPMLRRNRIPGPSRLPARRPTPSVLAAGPCSRHAAATRPTLAGARRPNRTMRTGCARTAHRTGIAPDRRRRPLPSVGRVY